MEDGEGIRIRAASGNGGDEMGQDTRCAREQVWLYRFAIFTAASTLPLLFMGGLVTSTGAGLAVPDWPTTFGYNMFLYPWSKMVGGIFYEHSHRLIGSAVGLLTTLLCLWLWLREPRPWLRWTGTAALIAVVVQGVLGGLRVVMLQHTLAIIHACFAQAFFALMVSIALFTSPQWMVQPRTMIPGDAGRLQRLCLLTSALLYLQVVVGAVLRHTGTHLDAHLLIAALVAIHVCWLAVRIWRKHAHVPLLTTPCLVLAALLVVQLGLGVGAYVSKYTATAASVAPWVRVALTTFHVVVGSLMLGTGVVLLLRSYCLRASSGNVVVSRLVTEAASG